MLLFTVDITINPHETEEQALHLTQSHLKVKCNRNSCRAHDIAVHLSSLILTVKYCWLALDVIVFCAVNERFIISFYYFKLCTKMAAIVF